MSAENDTPKQEVQLPGRIDGLESAIQGTDALAKPLNETEDTTVAHNQVWKLSSDNTALNDPVASLG